MLRRYVRTALGIALGLTGCAVDDMDGDRHEDVIANEQTLTDLAEARAQLSAKYNSLAPEERDALGVSIGGVHACDNTGLARNSVCAYLEFENGRIYNYNKIYSATGSDPHVMYGDIYYAWLDSDPAWLREASTGLPLTDELGTPDGRGRYNHFAGEGAFSIYWTPEYGAYVVKNWIRRGWAESGWESGPWGYPIANDYMNPWKNGRCGPNDRAYAMYTQDFENGFVCADLYRSWLVPWRPTP